MENIYSALSTSIFSVPLVSGQIRRDKEDPAATGETVLETKRKLDSIRQLPDEVQFAK